MTQQEHARDTAATLSGLRGLVLRVGQDDPKRRKVVADLDEQIDLADEIAEAKGDER